MAAIPPPGDNGSVVVRVPVPAPVGRPQPAPQPKPQAPKPTFILPGGVSPTPTRPLKLGRIVKGMRNRGS